MTHVGEERRFRFSSALSRKNDQLVRHVFQVGDIAPQPGYLGDPSEIRWVAFEKLYAVNIRPTISAFLLDIDSNLVVNRFARSCWRAAKRFVHLPDGSVSDSSIGRPS